MEPEQGPYPFAWSVLRLREQIGRPGWSWLHHDDDAMAAMYVAAMHDLLQCWQHHALLDRLAAPLAEPGRFLRTVAAFATAKLLFDDGNRVGFDLPTQARADVELHFTTPADEPLSLALLAPDAAAMARNAIAATREVLRAAVTDALTSAQGRVNRNRPGIVVLADLDPAAGLRPDAGGYDPAAFQSVGRKHRGVAAVAGGDAEDCADGTPRPARLRVCVLSAAQSAFRRREPDPTDASAGYRWHNDALIVLQSSWPGVSLSALT